MKHLPQKLKLEETEEEKIKILIQSNNGINQGIAFRILVGKNATQSEIVKFIMKYLLPVSNTTVGGTIQLIRTTFILELENSIFNIYIRRSTGSDIEATKLSLTETEKEGGLILQLINDTYKEIVDIEKLKERAINRIVTGLLLNILFEE